MGKGRIRQEEEEWSRVELKAGDWMGNNGTLWVLL